MESNLLQSLENKTITKKMLYQRVEKNFELMPELLIGISSPKASVRYGCASVLSELSAKYPENLYPHIDKFFTLLGNKHRILVWNAIAIIANLASVDTGGKLDANFEKYFELLYDDYMVTVANLVDASCKIALAKPYLIPKITTELLKVENLRVSPHLTEECKRVIAEKTIKSFGTFFREMPIREKAETISFAKKYVESPRKRLKIEAENFIKKSNGLPKI